MSSLPSSKWAQKPTSSEPSSTATPSTSTTISRNPKRAPPKPSLACTTALHPAPWSYTLAPVTIYPPPFVAEFHTPLVPEIYKPRVAAEPFVYPKKSVVRISAPPTNATTAPLLLDNNSVPASSPSLLDSPASSTSTSLLEATDLLSFQISSVPRLSHLESSTSSPRRSSTPLVPEGCLLPTFEATPSAPIVATHIATNDIWDVYKQSETSDTFCITDQALSAESILGQDKHSDTSTKSGDIPRGNKDPPRPIESSAITKAPPQPTQPQTSSPGSISKVPQSTNNMSKPLSTSNPYTAFVAEIDPDNSMDNGRAYVGGPRHYVDTPRRPNVRPAGPPARQPPPPSQNRPAAQPQPQPQPQPLRSPSPIRDAPPSKGFNQQGKSRFADRQPHSNSVWSGQRLMTASQLPADFFSTAKPKTVSGQNQAHNQGQNQSSQQNRPPALNPNPPPQNRPPLQTNRPPMQSPPANLPRPQPLQSPSVWSTAERPATSLVTARIGVNKDLVETSPRPSAWDQDEPAERPPASRLRNDADQEATVFRRERADSVDRIDDSDEESVVTSRSDQRSERKGEPPKTVQAELPGDPLFLQYPIGDGCHMVVAMYVERDTATAMKRFPALPRTRLMSAHKPKTMDQMAEIFKEALEDEKEACLG